MSDLAEIEIGRQLARKETHLPGTLPELRDYLLLAREKVEAYRLVLKSLDRQGAQEAYEQTLAEAQIVAKHALDAEANLGELLAAKGSHEGTFRKGGERSLPDGIDKKASHYAQQLHQHRERIAAVVHWAEKHGEVPTRRDVLRAIRSADIQEKILEIEAREVFPPDGEFEVIVIDPPWPVAKIEREERPRQVAFDYPTMDEEELSGLALPCAADCHVWLWATQKFLSAALRLLEAWELKHVATFVWHKPGGFQPFGLPQYNCEFALYARRGSPAFVDLKDFPVCFNAPRGGHSEKPGEFYATVRRVTAGRRLDMFNRRVIEGFTGWGFEAPRSGKA